METLIDVDTLRGWLTQPDTRIFDVRYALQDAGAGRELYRQGHIPGAQYASISRDLAGDVVPGSTGRHPLPNPETFIDRLQDWGIDSESRIVLYDDGSHFFVPRMWWMLTQWFDLKQVYILHGGIRAWQEAGQDVTDQTVTKKVQSFERTGFRPELREQGTIAASELDDFLEQDGVLLDARALERYRGEVEPLDTKAGHIPGAHCLPCADVLDGNGLFLPREQLRELFAPWQGREISCYCGSGVSACQLLLARHLAGLPAARLYPGSWSEWITDPGRRVATGDEIQ